jgi:lysine 2,3-aminomutase
VVCDVPFVGKRWVHQAVRYDHELGISYWTKNYRTCLEEGDADALNRVYPFYDPIDTLPASGQAWWRNNSANPCDAESFIEREQGALVLADGAEPEPGPQAVVPVSGGAAYDDLPA